MPSDQPPYVDGFFDWPFVLTREAAHSNSALSPVIRTHRRTGYAVRACAARTKILVQFSRSVLELSHDSRTPPPCFGHSGHRACEQFYCDVFEFEALFDYEWGSDDETFNSVIGMRGTVVKMCLLKGKNSYLELFEYLSPDSEADPHSLNASDRAISSRSADSAWRRSAA